MNNSTVVTAAICCKCGDTIYSRAHHDYHGCGCKATYIDGGFEYVRLGYLDGKHKPELVRITINATKQELFDDWNQRKNKFGTIKKLTNNGSTDKMKSVVSQ